ncbi:MAG: nitroreductase family protein [Desulfobacterales bacterium]
MDLYEVIEKRRTIRIFKKGATEEQLRKVILTGTKAPSALNRQPWEFIIVEDRSIIDRLAAMKYELTMKTPVRNPEKLKKLEKAAAAQKDSFKNASIVAVCNKVEWERSLWLCIENISLAAVAEGLGTGIVLYWDEEKHMAGALLGLPEDFELTAVLKIGVPGEEGYSRDQNPFGPRRPDFSWLHKDRYQAK